MKKNSEIYDIAIIGGGASGMMASISAAEIASGAKIVILEKNDKLGRKLLATGNGRCNFTNKNCMDSDFPLFSKVAMDIFDNNNTLALFEKIGVYHIIDKDGRAYPYSEQAVSVQKALLAAVLESGVNVKYNCEVRKICQEKAEDDSFYFDIFFSDNSKISARKAILSTGGKAGIQYGSDGYGYKLAEGFSHSIIKPIPSLVPLLSNDESLAELKGVRALGKASIYKGECLIDSEEGEVQFNQDGISGICIFNLSGKVRLIDINDKYENFSVSVDFFPNLNMSELVGLYNRRRSNILKRLAGDFFCGMLNEKLGPEIIKRSKINTEVRIGKLSDAELEKLAQISKNFSFVISGTRGFKEAQVTAGGINTDEINPLTMESNLVEGLFFCGEIIDVDAKCGGYNLQWAWTSGRIAGLSAGIALSF